MLDVAEERDVGDRGRATRKELHRIKRPFLAAVPQDKFPALVRGGQYDNERAKHLRGERGVLVRLEERPFAWHDDW